MTQQSTQADQSSQTRVERFSGDVSELDVPVPSSKRETQLLTVGVALVVLGVISILAGYWGASGTVNPAEQLPYMLSGGAVGLALVVVGAFLVGRYSMARLFRFWLARLLVEQRTQTDRIVEAIRQSK